MNGELEIELNDFKARIEENNKKTKKLLKKSITIFEDYFNIQQQLFSNCYNEVVIVAAMEGMHSNEQIALQTYLKNMHLLFSCHRLILGGQHGSAQVLFRQIFENLLIGKFVWLKKDDILSSKWLSGKPFGIYDKVIKLLANPDKGNIKYFWIYVCQITHASNKSNQITLFYKENRQQIYDSYQFLLLFLRCNYHLLNSYAISNRLNYRMNKVEKIKLQNKLLRDNAKIENKKIASIFKTPGIELIKDYEKKWQFKK